MGWRQEPAIQMMGAVASITTTKRNAEKGVSQMMRDDMLGYNMWAWHWLWMLVIGIVLVVPAWRICKRTGFPGWMGLLILIPFLNLFLLYFLAFSEWPADKRRGPGA